ncbi:MAG: sn-glycerol-3-phosphate ABC transporter ATP-binding protein UgpC [Pseudomonadota bacterium]
MADVVFDKVSKSYPGATAPVIDGLDLAVEDGELLVMVGPSGCGKSTVLRMLAGLETITGGELRIGGRRVNELEPKARDVAMVFQDYALYPHMSVRENLAFPLRMRRVPAAEQAKKIAWAAEMLHLGELLERKPAQLSGGQRQRVAMGRALVREAAVFLLDEPLSNLDAKLRVQVRAEIAALQRSLGTTMLYVTHDQTEAMTLGQRVAVFNQGRLKQVAAPRELYERPANTFVAGFIGQPPMNLIPVRVEGGRIMVGAGLRQLRVSLLAIRSQKSRASSLLQNGPVTLGIRPEDLRQAAPDEDGLTAHAELVEFLGHETLLHARLEDGDTLLTLRAPGRLEIDAGATVRLSVAGEVHLFSASDGTRLQG